MKYYGKPSFITTTVIAMGLMLSVGAQALEVITEGGNVLQILDLQVPNQAGDVNLYNVDFVSAVGSDVYGDNYDFDFTQGDAALARTAVDAALNVSLLVIGAGPDGTNQYFIGTEFADGEIGAVGAQRDEGSWGECFTDCGTGGTAVLQADQIYTYAVYEVATSTNPAVSDDYNKDGIADIAWFNSATRSVQLWLLDGSANLDVKTWPGTESSGDYTLRAKGDVDGDGDADLIWIDPTSGWMMLWNMEDGLRESKTFPGRNGQLNYELLDSGDFDGDGDDDILFVEASTGWVQLWIM
jgi:hypothetical protein